MDYPRLVIKAPSGSTPQQEIDSERLFDLATWGAGWAVQLTEGNFANHAFRLLISTNWIIGKDETGTIILVPLKKSP